VGSLQLAVLSKHFKKPFYVVANKSKFSSKNVFTQRKESPDEIWKNQSDKITIDNFYFEVVPARLITKIITD
jgi:translation initiation factor 2B subunit (eIF-2B alpha/beta/delta family)